MNIHKREIGEIVATSIGTAIPLEKIITGDVPIKGFSQLYLNMHTLHRNFYSSFSPVDIPKFKDYVNLFLQEIVDINSVIRETISGNIQPVFYTTTAKSLSSIMPCAKIKTKFTDKQKVYNELEIATLLKVLAKLDEINVQIFDVLIKGYKTSSLIITHRPIDLLSYYGFRQLVLLESHTGVTKVKATWTSKLTKNEQYIDLPFNILTFQLLGDHSLMLEGYGKKIIDEFILIAKEKRWTSLTTMEKMRFDIRGIKNKHLAELLLKMSMTQLK